MVRPDHEDGGVLSSHDEAEKKAPSEKKAREAVVRSSPLGRKKSPKSLPELVEGSSDKKPRQADLKKTQSVKTAPKPAAPLRTSGAERSRTFTVVGYLAGAVVIVLGVVASVVFAVGTHRIDDQRALRAEYETFARGVVVKMTTLDPENADAIYKFTMEKTSGRAQQTFRENMKQVSEMIRQGNEITKTTILADAVTHADANDGTVIMVAGWENRTKDKSGPVDFQTFRWKVDVTRINGELKLTNLEFVY
ncbi:MAG: hypothetical protein QM658_07335 [Gordonia sp. (in: high G+C Gram-positive bacteria)]